MQIKHTFLFTLILGLGWTVYSFGYVLGPDPGMNGAFGAGQTCLSCHTGNPLNAAGGSVTISGLPTDTGWTPGQTYALTVTIQKPGQRLFGFQLSAVSDASNQQAGSLAAGAGVKVICGGGTPATSTLPLTSCSVAGAIQYAEHSDARVVRSMYTVNWTAPASASTGTVRFNVAGNAANGDNNSTGDFIYTSVTKVDPAAAQPDLSTRAFTLIDRGGFSVITDGSGDLSVGYSRIQPADGNTTPSGVVIFGLRQNNTLITETGVPASVLLRSARIFGEVGAGVNTGLAIANPTNQTANINFLFTDPQGVDFGGGSLQIPPNQQIAKFLDEAPFSVLAGRPTFQGTFTFTSDVDVSVIALRGLTNERSEFLLTTLPVTSLPAAAASGGVSLAHFAEGLGWTTQIVLVNPSDSAITGNIQFFSQGSAAAAATAIPITANGQTLSSFDYNVPPRSSFKLVTSGSSPTFSTGSVRVTPTAGVPPSSLVVFSFRAGGVTVSEAGVPSVQAGQGSAFRMYVEETATGGTGAIQTGLAIANLSDTPATVNLELTDLNGSAATPATAAVTVPGNGQVARFLDQFFDGLVLPFKGVLRISGGGPAGLAVVGLRGHYNERNDFLITTTPPSIESTPASPAEFLFPHLVNGSGYTTQFILFSGTAGQASSGNLKFIKQDGTPLNLTLN